MNEKDVQSQNCFFLLFFVAGASKTLSATGHQVRTAEEHAELQLEDEDQSNHRQKAKEH